VRLLYGSYRSENACLTLASGHSLHHQNPMWAGKLDSDEQTVLARARNVTLIARRAAVWAASPRCHPKCRTCSDLQRRRSRSN
jgi:hypothetical protein